MRLGIQVGMGAAAGAIACGVALLGTVAVLVTPGAQAGAVEIQGSGQAVVSALARAEIPARYLALYMAAGRRYGVAWSVVAGIGRVECDHGQSPAPSCTQEGVENPAGAGGPMQFLAGTWAEYGVDGDGDGRADRWDPADAIFSAANYLRASGAPADYGRAIYAYNHAWWYVKEVEAWAARYSMGGAGGGGGGDDSGEGGEVGDGEPAGERGTGAGAGTGVGEYGAAGDLSGGTDLSPGVLYVEGEQAKLLRGDAHVALVPRDVPVAVQAMVVAGNELQDLPYGPEGHPDPLGARSEDCSSTVNYVLYEAGMRSLGEIVKDNPLAQDYVHWGDPGPGRWVTIYATDVPTPHVFIVIAGLRLDTSHNGTDEGPNRYEGGPRWRLLPYIPTWAHWSIRHPPKL